MSESKSRLRHDSIAMGKPKAKAKPATLASAGMYPMLSKTAVAIGKDAHVPGAFWTGCSDYWGVYALLYLNPFLYVITY